MKLSDILLEIKSDQQIQSTIDNVGTQLDDIFKDLDDQKSNFKTINTKDKMVELMDSIFNKLDPKFKESPMFKQSIIAIYNKYR